MLNNTSGDAPGMPVSCNFVELSLSRDAACEPELEKEVEVTLEKISDEGAIQLAKENKWPMSKLDLLKIMLD